MRNSPNFYNFHLVIYQMDKLVDEYYKRVVTDKLLIQKAEKLFRVLY